MENYVYNIKYVNAVNFIIVDLLRPVKRTVLVFDIKQWQNNEKIIVTHCYLTLCNRYIF